MQLLTSASICELVDDDRAGLLFLFVGGFSACGCGSMALMTCSSFCSPLISSCASKQMHEYEGLHGSTLIDFLADFSCTACDIVNWGYKNQ